MASKATLDKYRQKISGMGDDALLAEVAGLEDDLVRVAGELYALDTSPESLSGDRTHRSRVNARVNNRTMWDQRLDAAITELKGRGMEYRPSEEYGKLCDVAADIYGATRAVLAMRGEDGRTESYDLILSPAGMSARASGYGPFKPVTLMLRPEAARALLNTLLNCHVYSWGGSYTRKGAGSRARWLMDVYTADGGCVSFQGNVYRPHNFDDVVSIFRAVSRA